MVLTAARMVLASLEKFMTYAKWVEIPEVPWDMKEEEIKRLSCLRKNIYVRLETQPVN